MNDIAAREVLRPQLAAELLHVRHEPGSPVVVASERAVLAVALAARDERRDQILGPMRRVLWLGEAEPAAMQLEKLVENMVAESLDGRPGHERLQDEQTAVPSVYVLPRDRPACVRS